MGTRGEPDSIDAAQVIIHQIISGNTIFKALLVFSVNLCLKKYVTIIISKADETPFTAHSFIIPKPSL